jgi:hypothetical protein
MIKKPTIIITSLGRTGTKFFADLFRDVIPDCTSLHEPDVFNFFQYRSPSERISEVVKQLRESGIFNMTVRKALGTWSLIRLSDARIRGELSHGEALRRVLCQRTKFVHSRSGSIYIESSAAYYGLVDVLKDAFQYHRIVYIVRDGRHWVRSWMNWGGLYDMGRFRSLIAHNWPRASEIGGDPYEKKWNTMSRFEKVCWAWARLNNYALGTLKTNPYARLFLFEDIFESRDRQKHLEDLLHFVTTLLQTAPAFSAPVGDWLERKTHKSDGFFPSWKEWSRAHKEQFRMICGPLMSKLGYEIN